MKPEYYLFTFFVFALICVLLIIYWRVVLVQKGKRAEAQNEEVGKEREKEERLFRLYQNMEEMMDNFEAYIEDTRDQVEAVKPQMQQQADKINDLLRRVEATEASARSAVAALHAPEKTEQKKEPEVANNGKPAEEPPRRNSKQEAIRELLSKGFTVELIAQKLELSINEVKLVVYGMMSKNA
jgi:predicted transposase/invertase (TIGR01784 family)